MRRSLFPAVAGLVVIFLSGCNQEVGPPQGAASGPAQSGGGIAIIDLDEIARRMGRDEEIRGVLQSHQENLNAQLKNLQASYLTQLDQKQRSLAQSPTEAGSTELEAIKRQININLKKAKSNALTQLNQRRSNAIVEFREQIKPLAIEVAAERGLKIVVPRNDVLFLVYDDSVDITEEVAARLLSKGAAQNSSGRVQPTSPPLLEQPPQQVNQP